MADGELRLHLEDALVQRIAKDAAKVGLSPEAYLADFLEQHLFDYDGYQWDGDDPRGVSLDESNHHAPLHGLDDVMAEFREELEKRLAAKA